MRCERELRVSVGGWGDLDDIRTRGRVWFGTLLVPLEKGKSLSVDKLESFPFSISIDTSGIHKHWPPLFPPSPPQAPKI